MGWFVVLKLFWRMGISELEVAWRPYRQIISSMDADKRLIGGMWLMGWFSHFP